MYEARLVSVQSIYDGDTIRVTLDLGFGILKKEKFRLAFINAPEIKGPSRPEGLKSRDWLRNVINQALDEDKLIIVRTYKYRKGKYGRYIADIIIDGLSVNMQMVQAGLAEIYSS
jgi:micrococcal nuclease